MSHQCKKLLLILVFFKFYFYFSDTFFKETIIFRVPNELVKFQFPAVVGAIAILILNVIFFLRLKKKISNLYTQHGI